MGTPILLPSDLAPQVVTKAFDETNAIISGANLAALALGRFVFLPYQRNQLARAGMPQQNGMSHMAAGDKRAEEASFIVKTNDPAGEPRYPARRGLPRGPFPDRPNRPFAIRLHRRRRLRLGCPRPRRRLRCPGPVSELERLPTPTAANPPN